MKTQKAPGNDKSKYKVSGQVLNSKGESIADQDVLAVDVDLRGAAIYKTASKVRELAANRGFEFLGGTRTNATGHYEIVFTKEMYRRNEIGLADVVAFAVDGIDVRTRSGGQTDKKIGLQISDGKIFGRSKLATQKDYTGSEIQGLDIHLVGTTKRGISEYTRLIGAIEPFVRQNGLQLFELSGSVDQVSFLAAETKQDASHTTLAVQATKLCSDYPASKFSSELFYGIGRQNITLSWVAFLQENAESLTTAIQLSIAQNIIAPQESGYVKRFVANVLSVALRHSLTAPETAGFYKTIGYAVKKPALHKTFAQAYLQFSGQPADFWDSLKAKGFGDDDIKALQLTNQLSILTAQHTPLIEELQVNRAISDPSDLLSLTTDDWNAIIKKTGLPDSASGSTPEEKASNYISGMQSLLNAAYPTQKIALLIQNKQIAIADANVREKVSAFLCQAQQQKFNIASSRITDFGDTLKKIAGDLYDKTLDHLQMLQRIYQVSPTPEAMAALVGKYTSARHISSFSQSTFVKMEAKNLGGADVAFSIYNRARHQVMRAQHILLKMRDSLELSLPSRVISKDQQDSIRTYLHKLTP